MVDFFVVACLRYALHMQLLQQHSRFRLLLYGLVRLRTCYSIGSKARLMRVCNTIKEQNLNNTDVEI